MRLPVLLLKAVAAAADVNADGKMQSLSEEARGGCSSVRPGMRGEMRYLSHLRHVLY